MDGWAPIRYNGKEGYMMEQFLLYGGEDDNTGPFDWVAAIIVGLFSFLGTYLSNRKGQAVIAYRIQELEKKQDKHNSVIERTFRLEGRLDEVEHNIRVLKNRRQN